MEYLARDKLRFSKRFLGAITLGPTLNIMTSNSTSDVNDSETTTNSNIMLDQDIDSDVEHGLDAIQPQSSAESRAFLTPPSSANSLVSKERKGVERAVHLAPLSIVDKHLPVTSNQNSNVNNTYGPVQTINNNNANYTVYWGVPQDSDAIQSTIAKVLQARHVPEAVYDAQFSSGCMEGTRVGVLHEIDSWLRDLSAPQILWLTGPPGTGKTTIAWTVCLHASENPEMVLGGSFFCSRSAGSAAQRDVRRIIPTLAQLLARQSTEFSQVLAKELARDPDVLHKQVTVQVKKLLHAPLLALKDSDVPVIFVIDALDECGGQLTARGTLEDPESVRIMTDMLTALISFSRSAVKLPVKFLVTSRPESHILNTPLSDAGFSKVLQLNKQQDAADIHLYISTRLSSTKGLRNAITGDDADKLAQRCDGLFIAAATALHHTLDAGKDNVTTKFKTLLVESGDCPSDGETAAVDRMYALILAEAARADGSQIDGQPAIIRPLAAILSAQVVLSVTSLADLMLMRNDHLRVSLSQLHAVVHIPESDDEPGLRILHTTFGDYLLSRGTTEFRISESLGHGILARGCLRVMEMRLHFNISQSRTSYNKNSSTPPQSITLAIQYSCMQWIYHIVRLSDPSSLDTEVHELFRQKFLFWLEVMSILEQTRRAAPMLIMAAGAVRSITLLRFFRDANSFVAFSQDAIERSPPHIYISALPFAKTDSLVYQYFAPLFSGLLAVNVSGIAQHGECLVMTLTGHEDGVNSIAYSPNGRFISSASADGTVRVWDMLTGEEMITALCSGHGPVWSVAFAPDGGSIASGTERGVLCVWTLVNGQATSRLFTGHSSAIFAVAFSPDGSLIASGSMDKTARVWNSTTGQQLMELRGHSRVVRAIAFSTDSRILASGSDDATLRLWYTVTSETVNILPHNHGNPIYSISFSADGTMLAVGSGHDVILCQPQTGGRIRTLYSRPSSIWTTGLSPDGQSVVSADGTSVCISTTSQITSKISPILLDGHTDKVRCVTFSSDGLYIASASDDHTIRIWNAGRGQTGVLPLPCHTDSVRAVAVSPDCATIASGSHDESVRIWNSLTGEESAPPLMGHQGWVSSVAISSDGHLIASGSGNRFIRLWNKETGAPITSSTRRLASPVTGIALSSDTRWLASSLADGTVKIWDLVTERYSAIGTLHCEGTVHSISFSHDGRLIAAGDESGYLHLWQIETGQRAREPLQACHWDVKAVAFSPDCTRVAFWWKGQYSSYLEYQYGR